MTEEVQLRGLAPATQLGAAERVNNSRRPPMSRYLSKPRKS